MGSIGILAIGTYLPAEVRTNDWWSPDIVASWQSGVPGGARPDPRGLTPNARRVLAAISSQNPDPFQGTHQRRVAAAETTSCDMEVAAAEQAIARAGIPRESISVLLTHSVAPEYLLTNTAAPLHHRLGLRGECLAIQAEAAAYSFLAQLTLAQSLLAAAGGGYALLVQSSISTRLVEGTSRIAPLCGDGASAVIVGPVSTNGIIAATHFVDGAHPNSLVVGVPHKTWYAEGRPVLHIADPVSMGVVLLQTVDLCQRAVAAVLERAGLSAGHIDFFCIHQGTAWLRSLAQEVCGMPHARSVDTFSETAYLFGAIMPFGLRRAEDEGLLRRGDRVMMFGGGTGMVYGATVMEWGT